MDTQQTELVARSWLITQLLTDGLEVARPERDRGVDLLAYLDLMDSGRFVARPIQMKAATTARFGIARKYARIADLLVVFVWLRDGAAYGLTVPEALGVADEMGYTSTASWTVGGKYDTTRPSRALQALLAPYRMEAGDWYRRVAELAPSERPETPL